jgi:hypothetical protein
MYCKLFHNGRNGRETKATTAVPHRELHEAGGAAWMLYYLYERAFWTLALCFRKANKLIARLTVKPQTYQPNTFLEVLFEAVSTS